MTDTAIIERDEAVTTALEEGRSLAKVRKQFGLSVSELDAVLERCFPLDTAARLRTIRSDLSKLDVLIEKLYLRAISDEGDVNSATAVIRAWERKAELLGLDAVQRVDLTITPPQYQESRHDRIRQAIFSMARGPDYRPNGGDSAVGALSDSGDKEPSR
jgi:hypothetical protein